MAVLLSWPLTSNQASAADSSPDGSRTVIAAQLFVDDDNAGNQDGSALHPYKEATALAEMAGKMVDRVNEKK
jgi:hypothetical protein